MTSDRSPGGSGASEGTARAVTDRYGGRRQFLRTAAGGLALGTASALAGCEHDTDANPTPDNSGSLPVRKSISTLEQSDPDNILGTFEDAVSAMRDRDDSLSWQNIAQIHGDAQDFIHCRHGNWLFLPWHRAYLAFFEDICRELGNNEDFALPYWNWAANPQLPSTFTDSSSALYDSTRASDPDADGPSTDQSTMQAVLDEPNFQRFAGDPPGGGNGDLESPPHGTVHMDVGGWGGNMASSNSPLDPVFWVHHCMVDYVWWEWNWGQGNPNTNDANWTDTKFQNEFVDRDGNDVAEIAVQDTLFTPLESHAGYETTALGTSQPGARAQAQETETQTEDARRTFLEEGADVQLETLQEVPVGRELEVHPREPIEAGIGATELERLREFVTSEKAATGEIRLDLAFRDVSLPARTGAMTRMFVNQPEPVIEEPRQDPRFAGSLVFFKGPETEGSMTTFVNVTDVLRRLLKQNELFQRDELTFQIVPDPSEAERAEGLDQQAFTVDSLSLRVTQSFIGDHALKTDEGERTDEQTETDESG